MSLFRSSLRPPAAVSDEAIERHLATIRAEIEPDPLFRRRLRGHVLNRYVGAREERGRSPEASKEMGRLGRAMLYATFALAVGVTGTMAAARHAIPGGFLYPLKLQIAVVRAQVVPERLQDDLAAHILGQRIEELRRLSEAGDWAAVEAHATVVEAAYDALAGHDDDAAALARHLEAAEARLARLPEQARASVERAMSDDPVGVPGPGVGAPAPRDGGPPTHAGGAGAGGSGPNSRSDRSGAPVTPAAMPSPVQGSSRSEPTARPQPRPTRSAKPAESPTPTPVASPTATP